MKAGNWIGRRLAALSLAALAFVVALGLAPAARAEMPAWAAALGHNNSGSREVFVSYRAAPLWQGFQPVVGASMSTHREVWAGVGLAYTWRGAANATFLRAAVMPGLYGRGNGRDLGGPFMIRSSIEAGWVLRAGGELAIGLAHRSNAGIHAQNPGLDTLYLTYSMPLR
ncbi:MAG: acyloxyacyl hydrolase [Pararhodobacter sp.]